MATRRMTMAQALIQFLKNQYVERDGQEHLFFAGMLGIPGTATWRESARPCNRIQISLTIWCATSSPACIWRRDLPRPAPSSHFCLHLVHRARRDNMITGAALATINRLPVLLLPGDIFAAAT